MTENQTFQQLFKSARSEIGYKVDRLITEITEQITDRMDAEGLSKSDLAARIKVTAPYVTKVLRGETNFTAESMVKISHALNCDVEVKLVPRTSPSDWIDIFGRFVERSPEMRVWSQHKEETVPYRGGLRFVHCPSSYQSFLHESH